MTAKCEKILKQSKHANKKNCFVPPAHFPLLAWNKSRDFPV
jgi:hypothetical protein